MGLAVASGSVPGLLCYGGKSQKASVGASVEISFSAHLRAAWDRAEASRGPGWGVCLVFPLSLQALTTLAPFCTVWDPRSPLPHAHQSLAPTHWFLGASPRVPVSPHPTQSRAALLPPEPSVTAHPWSCASRPGTLYAHSIVAMTQHHPALGGGPQRLPAPSSFFP